MIRFFAPASLGLVSIVSVAGCSFDRSAPHPFVVDATAETSYVASAADRAVTVPTAPILRDGKPLAASARVPAPWPAARIVASPPLESAGPDMIEAASYTVTDLPEVSPPVMPDLLTVPAQVLPPEEYISIAPEAVVPEYIEVSAVPSGIVLPPDPALTYDPVVDPVVEPVSRPPVSLPYGASL